MVILGGWVFLMSEVPLSGESSGERPLGQTKGQRCLQATISIRHVQLENTTPTHHTTAPPHWAAPPPDPTIAPLAQSYRCGPGPAAAPLVCPHLLDVLDRVRVSVERMPQPARGHVSRMVDSCITQPKAQGPCRTCDESKCEWRRNDCTMEAGTKTE